MDEIAGSLREAEKALGTRIFLHTDAAQALGKVSVSAQTLGVDYLTIVGHKFYGPRIGALYVRALGKPGSPPLRPMLFGGGQERNYRPGTENTPMIAGLGEAARLVTANLALSSSSMRIARDHFESLLSTEFGEAGVAFNGRVKGSHRLPNTSNFSVLGGNREGWRVLKASRRFVASLGAACHSDHVNKPSHILLQSGVTVEVAKNAVRFSLGRATTIEEVEEAAREIIAVVRAMETVE